MSNKKILLAALAGVSFVSLISFGYSASAQSEEEAYTAHEQMVISTVEKSSPAVVSIIITKDIPVLERFNSQPFDIFSNDPFFRQFFLNNGIQLPQLEKEQKSEPKEQKTVRKEIGGGSGFIVSSDGMIVTNKHVAKDKDASYTVMLNDGRKFDAKIVDQSPDEDIAILKVDGRDLPTLTLGNSDKLKLGQSVIAIGNALGEFRNTVSVGVISGKLRTLTASSGGGVEKLEGVLQTDAAINPGNSGGPLLNLRGEVIGINVAVAQGAQNIGFSIPSNKVKKIVKQVQALGKIVVTKKITRKRK